MQAFTQCKPHFNHQLAVLWHGRSRGQWGARTRSLFLGAVGCSAAPLGLCWGKQDLAHKSWVALWLGCSLPLALQAVRSVRWASPTSWPDPTDCPNACSSCPCTGRVLRPYWLSKCLLLLPLQRKGAQGSLPGSQTLTHHCHVWIQGHFRNPSDVGTTCPSEVWLPRSQNPDQIWGLVFYKNAVWVVKLGACRPLLLRERLGYYSGYKPGLSPTVLK